MTQYAGLEWSSGLQLSRDHKLWGIFRVRYWDDGTVEIIPRRTEQGHWDVTGLIMGNPNGLKIEVGPPPGDNLFDFYITLYNPSPVKGYDVTGIVRHSGDIIFHNPDSYTKIFSLPGDTVPDPFAAWDTGIGNREFPGWHSQTEQLRFEKPGLTKFVEMDYIFQASWPDNQEEPYGIWGIIITESLQSNGSNAENIRCRVGDWQGNVDSVTIDLTAIGGPSSQPMSFLEDNIWVLNDVSYSPTGQGPGIHKAMITATSGGVSTYNYLMLQVSKSGPITDGSFDVQYQNLPLGEPNGPTDGMDIAVLGALDGTQVGMVFGGDDTYHFWSSDYKSGTFGLYYEGSGDPVTPFDLPNFRFDFADQDIPDTSVDSLFNLSWGETNSSTEILDPDTIPPVMANERIALWYLNDGSLKLTGNVLVLGADPGPPQTFQVIVRPIEYASGFRGDGLLYMMTAFAAGDEAQFPIVDIIALHPPLDFAGNLDGIIADGYEIAIDQGAGTNFVNRQAIVGMDVDDSGILEITGGYAGHSWVAVVEAAPENVLEIIDADLDAPSNTFITVPLPSAPKDVEILPLKNAGQASNWIAVLCADNKIRLYDYSGNLMETIGGSPYMVGDALRLDIDDENLAIHVLHQGPTDPLVTVYKWAG